jgi:ApbE superfamily uncharacterized protein (UPF0280 family)
MLTTFGTPVVVTNTGGSTVVKKQPGQIVGFYVNSTTSGTLAFYDAATAVTTTAVSGTITPAVGWHSFPAALVTGCYIVVGGTINATIFVQ